MNGRKLKSWNNNQRQHAERRYTESLFRLVAFKVNESPISYEQLFLSETDWNRIFFVELHCMTERLSNPWMDRRFRQWSEVHLHSDKTAVIELGGINVYTPFPDFKWMQQVQVVHPIVL